MACKPFNWFPPDRHIRCNRIGTVIRAMLFFITIYLSKFQWFDENRWVSFSATDKRFGAQCCNHTYRPRNSCLWNESCCYYHQCVNIEHTIMLVPALESEGRLSISFNKCSPNWRFRQNNSDIIIDILQVGPTVSSQTEKSMFGKSHHNAMSRTLTTITDCVLQISINVQSRWLNLWRLSSSIDNCNANRTWFIDDMLILSFTSFHIDHHMLNANESSIFHHLLPMEVSVCAHIINN